eukprot:23892-Eustigmatos_ZCMA.PRE.1
MQAPTYEALCHVHPTSMYRYMCRKETSYLDCCSLRGAEESLQAWPHCVAATQAQRIQTAWAVDGWWCL